eukprot:403332275
MEKEKQLQQQQDDINDDEEIIVGDEDLDDFDNESVNDDDDFNDDNDESGVNNNHGMNNISSQSVADNNNNQSSLMFEHPNANNNNINDDSQQQKAGDDDVSTEKIPSDSTPKVASDSVQEEAQYKQQQSASQVQSTNQQKEQQQKNGTAQQQTQQQQQQAVQQIEILGAVKVRDGLFLGDEFASQDLEFVIANKVTHIINGAGRQIFNQWTPVGVKYLTFYWLDDDRQLIFDDLDQVAKEIYDFIEEANQDASGVLVHSVRGQSRACCVLSIYLMMKFKWTLLKSLEFINSRRPNLEIRASFLQQLSAWERRTRDVYPRRTDRWDELFHQDAQVNTNNKDSIKDNKEEDPTNTKVQLLDPAYEELLLRNTFMNAQMQPVNFLQQWKEDVLTSISQSHRARHRLRWGDNNDENLKHQLAREKSEVDFLDKDNEQLPVIDNFKKQFQGKTILKKKPKKQIASEKIEESKKDDANEKIELEIQETPKSKVQQQQETQNSDLVNLEGQLENQKPNKKQRNRAVTPLISNGTKRNENNDLLSTSPKSFRERDRDMLIASQQPGSVKNKPKRAQSSKKIDKELEEKEKRDKFKAKIAWNATSPKSQGTSLQNTINFKDQQDNLSKRQLTEKSPLKGTNSNILKKELLEKAKQSLAENSKVTVGLDIKKIQETLNKIRIESKPIINPNISTQKSQGNIINNNNISGKQINYTIIQDSNVENKVNPYCNINNFYIQNASVIEMIPQVAANNVNQNSQQNANLVQTQIKTSQQQPVQNDQQPIKKIQAPIGQFHHKRANSGSLQMAQQIKQNLAQQSPFQYQNLQQQQQNISQQQVMQQQIHHRKNQLSEQLVMQQPFQQIQLQTQQNSMNQSYQMQNTQASFDQQLRQSLTRPQSGQNSNATSRKDFKQVLRQLQKESLSAMQNSQNFWLTQAKKFQLKSQQINYAVTSQQQQMQINPALKAKQQAIMQLTQQMKSNNEAKIQGLLIRPQSAQGQSSQQFKSSSLLNTQNNTMNSQGSVSINKNRRLRKSNEFLPTQQQILQYQQKPIINKHQRRAQTPMPSSPSQNILASQQQISSDLINKTQKLNNNSGLIIQNMSLNNGSQNLNLSKSMKPTFKKRSKSPSVSSYQNKLQQKTVYMLLNNTFAQPQNPSSNTLKQKLSSQSLKRKTLNSLSQSADVTQRGGFVQSPKKNSWVD